MAGLTVDDLTYRYPGAPAATLEHLSLAIASGEAHALLGGSGAGKTTLLNLLSGLLEPTAGALRLDGRDLAPLSPGARGIAQVFQFPVLYDSLSVLDNLTMPLRARGVGARARRAQADVVARQLGYADLGFGALDRVRPASLSLYQKQLLAVGKALLTPDLSLLLLDEPLTAVEPSLKWRLRQTLKAVQADRGVTMVYVTHDQTEALTFADRVSVMRDGKILQTAAPSALYDAPEHTWVGHFIGSPGLNLIDAELVGDVLVREDWRWPLPAAERCGVPGGWPAGPVQLGFRPEWGRLQLDPQAERAELLRGPIVSRSLQGLDADGEFGLTELALPEPVRVRGPLTGQPGALASLLLSRFVLFRDQQRLANIEDTPC